MMDTGCDFERLELHEGRFDRRCACPRSDFLIAQRGKVIENNSINGSLLSRELTESIYGYANHPVEPQALLAADQFLHPHNALGPITVAAFDTDATPTLLNENVDLAHIVGAIGIRDGGIPRDGRGTTNQ